MAHDKLSTKLSTENLDDLAKSFQIKHLARLSQVDMKNCTPTPALRMTHWLPVLVQTPAHSQVAGPLSYRSELALAAGTLVRVPLGQRETLGVVWDAPVAGATADVDAARTCAPSPPRSTAWPR